MDPRARPGLEQRAPDARDPRLDLERGPAVRVAREIEPRARALDGSGRRLDRAGLPGGGEPDDDVAAPEPQPGRSIPRDLGLLVEPQLPAGLGAEEAAAVRSGAQDVARVEDRPPLDGGRVDR